MNIIVRMMGGLGNQIFIYAFARQILKIYPEARVILDLRWYEKHNIRNYELYQYELNQNVTTLNQADIAKHTLLWFDITRGVYKIIEKVSKKFGKKGTEFLESLFVGLAKKGYCFNQQRYENVIIPQKKNIFVYGYFQDYRYIEQVKTELDKELSITNCRTEYRAYVEQIEQNATAISIRWGDDYIKFGWPICSDAFFLEGIKKIRKDEKSTQIVVFCDERKKFEESALKESLLENYLYIEDMSPAEGLSLMMKCKHFVISNSTFSWLGAVLGKRKESIVVAPRQWFRNKEVKQTDLYLEEMIVMENQ